MADEVRYLRQVIVVRKDLTMPQGKLAAMVAHAAMTFITDRLADEDINAEEGVGSSVPLPREMFTKDEWQWLTEIEPGLEDIGQVSFAKIVLAVDSLAALEQVELDAKSAGLVCCRVTDGGHSHNKHGDVAAIAIGPAWPEQLVLVTGHLKVYR